MKRFIASITAAAMLLLCGCQTAEDNGASQGSDSSTSSTESSTSSTESSASSTESSTSSTSSASSTESSSSSTDSSASSTDSSASSTDSSTPSTSSTSSTESSTSSTSSASSTESSASSTESSTSSTESSTSSTESSAPSAPGTDGIDDLSTMEIVHKMGFGINLGNTLESCGDWINSSSVGSYETAWGSPVVTREMINGYADAGFGVLRIPVAWSNIMSDDGKYTISPDYMARVKEVVGWALDTGMFVIINIHYDGGWVNVFPENKDESMKRFKAMWTQIADGFKDFGARLVFESQNEELGWESIWNRWSGSAGDDKKASYSLVNEVNQAFVDVVRGSGGYNPRRHLLISGYNTDIALTCDELFRMPNDPAGRMAVSVHYYEPSTLTIIEEDVEWGKARTDWGSAADIAGLERNVAMLKKRFTDNGVPVIVGEYGCFGKNKTREVIESYLTDVSSRMYAIGACPILWDTTGNEYDRKAYKFKYPEFIAKLIAPSR